MSRQTDTEWTTITTRPHIATSLDEFYEMYDFKSKGEAVQTLLSIAESAGVPVSEEKMGDVAGSINLRDVETIAGFLFKNDDDRSVIVGRNGSQVTAITDVSEPQSPVQPMARTNITDGIVICPACGTELMTYSLSDSLPGIESGVFNGLNVGCDTCDRARPYYTLFVSQPGATVSTDALAQAMRSYFAYMLVLETVSPDDFKERVEACSMLALDGGWEWLPDPKYWVGFGLEEVGIGPVTPGMYSEFLQRYLKVFVEEVDGVRIMDIDVISPSDPRNKFNNEWQLQLETRGSNPEPGVEEFQEVTELWETVELEVEWLDQDTFADYTILATLSGLKDLE